MASALSVGFISASISYDFDTDPDKRRNAPNFYGFIPASARKRSLVFITMLLLSGLLLIVKCLTIVLFGLAGGKTLIFAYIGADLALYFIVKILRGDFWYWMPFGGLAEVFSSSFIRLIVKTLTDFTLIVQFRHPNEIGGAYWTFGLFLTTASLPFAISVYGQKVGKDMVYEEAM